MTETQVAPTFTDKFQEMSFNMLVELINDRNSTVGRLNAASGDRVTLTEEVTNNSNDPEIVAAREALAEAVLHLDNLVKPIVDKHIEDSAGSTEELETNLKDIDSKLKPGVTYYKKSYGDEAAAHLPEQVRVKGVRVSGGAGGRRIRGFNIDVTIDGETETFENFTKAANYLDVETAELQDAFFKKAGVDDPKKAPDSVNLALNIEQDDEEGNKSESEALIHIYRVNKEGTASTEAPAESEVTTPDESDLENIV